MNSRLTFKYEFSRDEDDFGWLTAQLETPDFSGRNGMWVQWQDILDFAASLARYPIPNGEAIECEWGFGEQSQYTAVTKVRIAPIGPTRGVTVAIALANYHQPENHCRTRFETDYPSLSEFRLEIERMMQDRCGAATLIGFKENDR